MITKRTRVLSFIATLLMLVSMLACIVIPASAEITDPYQAVLDDIVDSETKAPNLTAAVEAAKTDSTVTEDTLLKAAQDDAAAATIEWIAFDGKENPYPRYAYRDAYLAAGYDTENWSITEVVDWTDLIEDHAGINVTIYKTLYVTNNIDFDHTPMKPVAYSDTGVTSVFRGSIYGQGHVFENIKIKAAPTLAGQYAGVALIGVAGAAITIDGLGLTGEIINESTVSGNHYGGSFIGACWAETTITNCWTDLAMSVNYTHGTRSAYTSALVASNPNEKAVIVDNCYLDGSMTNYGGPAVSLVHHNMALGTGGVIRNTITSVALTSKTGTNGVAVIADAMPDFSNVLSVNAPMYLVGGVLDSTTNVKTSDGEAAYEANKNFSSTLITNREYYFSVDADGKLCFSDADHQVRRLSIRGNTIDDATKYIAQGSSVSFVSLGLEEPSDSVSYVVTKASNDEVVAVENGAFTVPADDVNIVATYDASVALNTAKEELQVLINQYDKIDATLLTDTSAAALATFNANAAAAMTGGDKDVVDAAIAEGEGLSIELSYDYPKLPQFKDYAIYDKYNTANKWLIAEREDWTDAVAMGTAADVLSAEFHLANDIDMKGSTTDPIAPLAVGGKFTGKIYGHGKNFVDVDITGTSNVGLIASVQNATLDNLGIASGTIKATGSSVYSVGAFVGQSYGLTVIKCWNGADVSSTGGSANAMASALVGDARAEDTARYLYVNGFYNVGTITSTGTGTDAGSGAYANVIYNNGHNHSLRGLFNIFNAGTMVSAAGLGGRFMRSNFNAGYPVLNTASNDTNVNVHYYDNKDLNAETIAARYEATKIANYETGEIGYVLNQGNSGLKDYNNAEVTPVYFTLKDGKVVFGADNGSDQIRKVSFDGAITTPVYLNAGTADYDLAALAPGATFEIITENATSSLDATGTKLTLANEDITIKVTGETVDTAVYETAKATLENFVQIDASLFSNEDLPAAILAATAALEAVEADDSVANMNAVITEAEKVAAISLDLADGKKVPFAGKDDIYKDVDANGEYGIYSVEDWNAFATGSRSGKVYLMKSLTLPADAENLAGASLNCTFDGQGNTLTVNATMNLTSGQHTGFFGQGNTIQNLTVAGSFTLNIGTEEAPVTSHTYIGAITGSATMTSVTNEAAVNIKAYGTTGATRLYVGALVGSVGVLTNCTNNGAITAEGYAGHFAVGGIGGRNNLGVDNNTNLLNTGVITVTDTSTEGEYRVYAGGIFGNTAGNSMKDVKNTGDIKVIGGREVYVGGIQAAGTETNANYIDGAVNEGKIEVTPNEGATVYAAGIMGFNSWPMMGTISNSGDIIVDAKNAAKVHITGIAAEFSTHALTNVSAEGLVNTEITATNTGDLWLGGVKEATADHTVEQITGDAQVTKTESCVATGTMAAVCEHGLGETVPATETTHTVICDDAFGGVECSFSEVEDCTYAERIEHTATASYEKDTDTLTSTHTAVCGCGHEMEDACSYEKHPATCEEALYFTFTCGQETLTIADSALDHDFEGALWNDDEQDPNKQYQLCKNNCGTMKYQTKGFVEAEGIAMNANRADGVITITLPDLTEGTITLSLTGKGYKIISVTGATETAVDNVYAYAGNEIKVTIESAKTVVEDGVLRVDVTGAKNSEGDVSDAFAEVNIRFAAIDGDADADGFLKLGDALATLYYVAGGDDYQAAHPINTYNANLYHTGNRDDCEIDINDAYAVVKEWLRTAKF